MGLYPVKVTVSDGDNGFDHHHFFIWVIEGDSDQEINFNNQTESAEDESNKVDINNSDQNNPVIYNNRSNINDNDQIEIKPNNIPKLSNGNMEPSFGDTETEFTFSVIYTYEDSNPPEYVRVIIDNMEYDMTLKDQLNSSVRIYEYRTKLSEGRHCYYFMAADSINSAVSGDDNTPLCVAEALIIPLISEPEKGQESPQFEMPFNRLMVIALMISFIVLSGLNSKAKARILRTAEILKK